MICLICNQDFNNSRSLAAHIRHNHNISSKEYYDKFLLKNNEDVCICGNYNTFKSITSGYCKFCSYSCSESYRCNKISLNKKNKSNYKLKGYIQSEEHINKRIRPSFIMSESTKQKISDSLKGKFSGSNNPNWRGGSSYKVTYGKDFTNNLKEYIRARDKRLCQLCNTVEGSRKLSIHHIDYDKNNNNKNNLISLCIPCHSKTNFNRSMWFNIFSHTRL